ncbi:MAG TPA: hypothetical protein DEB73_00200 [Candidatus Magasanikbacteria bacterium]|uniref:Uncharacterized protein n=2 Tax=Candidatus Magasanikiibacteriota TaxID=1752731 RepID=A0A0G0YVA8_9BACT|nr:MAG: hypothetical protein UU49_C0005G0069 [Candidatus Magasanikbacteria bacterium GW2011_GWC2_41_17]KKS13596.1 MAG: hypothetical protein UU69_C0002G0031 [Candidatus Magasanikbacteria bacterium GW2011_GWA2_41_55]HBV57689.1 hypothetical protein [Candidatus Magasanikbacteria bacterium]HBX16238.1 hypothetical protein [Candidatus Magasanikbacteria bacterium]
MNDATLSVLKLIRDFPKGTEITIPCRGEWECMLTSCCSREWFTATVQCPETDNDGNPTGRYKFFTVKTSDRHGPPKVTQEPTLGIPCRAAGVDIHGHIISGLVIDADGKITKRLQWSYIVFVEKRDFEITPTGLLFVQDPAGTKFLVGRLRALFLPDKNRLDGYIGVFGPSDPDNIKPVKILNMEDLLSLASL